MHAYRLARYARRYDLSGYGANLFGGRWNLRGTSLLCTAEVRSLAVMEVLVHLTSEELPNDMYLLTVELPEGFSQEEIAVADLPANWRQQGQAYPTALLGHAWLQSARSLALRVPSVLVPQEHNLLLNPAHSDFGRVRLAAEPEPFYFDERLQKNIK